MNTAAAPAELVLFSPLPPNPSGVAAYTAELLSELGRMRRCTAVVATEADAAAVPVGIDAEVISERAYLARPALHGRPHLHQLGNSLDHAHVLRAALRRPGVVTLHDVVLHHLIEALTLGRGSPHAYEAALAREHGPAGRRLARLRRLGLFAPMQRFLMPLHGGVLERSRSVIVHSRFAAARLQAPPGLPVSIVPHHLSPAVFAFDGIGRAAARARLGLPPETRVLLVLGHVTPPKQAGVVLAAMARLRAEGLDAVLVIGGAVEAGLPIAAEIAALGLGDRVRLTGWLPEEAFFLHLRAADLLLALRFPVAGESSGTLARALGMGTPALAYDVGPAAEYPDSILARLAFAPDPVAALAARIAALLADPVALAAQGEAARRWMRAHRALSASVSAYCDCLAAWA
ncbi:MAG: glycosyltransferase [Acetobacteraceae bacterium]|nr:glycosyltransferase [Acetobacteraceae bacterium]